MASSYKAPTLRAAQRTNKPSGVELHVETGQAQTSDDPLGRAAYSNRHNLMQFQPGVYHPRSGKTKSF